MNSVLIFLPLLHSLTTDIKTHFHAFINQLLLAQEHKRCSFVVIFMASTKPNVAIIIDSTGEING